MPGRAVVIRGRRHLIEYARADCPACAEINHRDHRLRRERRRLAIQCQVIAAVKANARVRALIGRFQRSRARLNECAGVARFITPIAYRITRCRNRCRPRAVLFQR